MDTKAPPHRRNMAIAVATGLGTNTVRRYYEGADMRVSHFEMIEAACVRLGYPLRDDGKKGKARHV